MTRFVDLAVEVSEESDHKHFQMSAVVVKGGRVLSKAANKGWNHAESRALLPHADFSGATIFVMRRNRKMSKPCSNCMEKIFKARIANIVYANRDGEIIKQRVYS